MQRIFNLLREGGYPNRRQLAEEIEVTVKTVQRDIDFMRDQLSLPIDYNSAKGGYYFTEDVSQFPMLELTESEIVSVFVAQRAAAQYKGTPFEQPLRSAFEKLTSSLNGKLAMSWTDSMISFRATELTPLDLSTFQAVSSGVKQSLAIDFDYKKLGSPEFQKRRIEPYHLACILNQWYCFGNDVERKEMRTFVVARMRNAVLTNAGFKRPAKFSISNHLKDSFGVFSTKGMHQVVLQFDAFAAQLVREWVWHPSQKIRDLPDGAMELTLSLSSLTEIKPWVLNWGAHVKVLGPAELVDKVKTSLSDALKQYT